MIKQLACEQALIFVVIKDVARAAKPRVTSRRAQRAGERSGTRNESLQGRHCFFRQRVRPRTQHSDWFKMTAPVILSDYDTNQRVGEDQINKHGFGNSKCRLCA